MINTVQKKIQGNIIIDIPKTCPLCHEVNTPVILNCHIPEAVYAKKIGVLLECSSCTNYFALSYFITSMTPPYSTNLNKYTYSPKVIFGLPEELDSVSPLFRNIYMQSLIAEAMQLDQIAGVGYRKSIEFLIKDYLILTTPEKESTIKKSLLSNAINMIESKSIKQLALAATWIGNDETHYIRKYEDKDITDMKQFLKALAYQVSSEVVSSRAQEMISAKESK